jgi:hypothetical protein
MLIRTKYKAPKLQGIDDKIIATGIDALCEDITDDGDGIYELTQEGEIVKGLIEQSIQDAKSQSKTNQRIKDIELLTDLLANSKEQPEAYKWGILDSLYQLRNKEE